MMDSLTTDRLVLRPWRDSDRQPFAELNADPRVMEFMPRMLTREESDELRDRIERHFVEHGFGLFAAEFRQTGALTGFVGLSVPNFQARFTPCVEIGWRLAAGYWGRGLATEGAREVLRYAFQAVGLDEVVSFTVPGNRRSVQVMQKIGMTRDPAEDFDHPGLPAGHLLRRHVLYRISRQNWLVR